MTGHRIPYDLAKGDYHVIANDGDDISIAKWSYIGITTGASGETNTLNDPSKVGLRVTFNMMTDGGGDRVITADSAINQAGNTIMTFAAVDDMCILESVQVDADGNCEWRVVANDGVALS